MIEEKNSKHVKALFISDVHLGMKTIKVDQLLDFLHHYDAETIYLVGDILDGWRLQKKNGGGQPPTIYCCKSYCTKRVKARASFTCQATMMSFCATILVRTLVTSKLLIAQFTMQPMVSAIW